MTGLEHEDCIINGSEFPGILFEGPPTSSGNGPGITLTSEKDEDVTVSIRSCLSGPFELPDGYELVSPAYLIEVTRRPEKLQKFTLKIDHFASLQSEDDCEMMSFISAPRPRDSKKPVYVFEIIKSRGIEFKPECDYGEIETRHFCIMAIAKRIKSSKNVTTYFSCLMCLLCLFSKEALLCSVVSYFR
jgi:hypothetical protein